MKELSLKQHILNCKRAIQYLSKAQLAISPTLHQMNSRFAYSRLLTQTIEKGVETLKTQIHEYMSEYFL